MNKEESRQTIWRHNNPLKVKIINKNKHLKEKTKFPDKFLAWKNDYIKKGIECQVCKSKEDLEFHHTNYKKHEGITLCRRCHRNLHNTTKKGVKNGNN